MNQSLSCAAKAMLSAALTMVVFPLFSQTFTAKTNVSMTGFSNGYYEYLPEGYATSGKSYPLLVFFHGLGETGNGSSDLYKILSIGTPRQINQGIFPKSFTVNGETHRFIVLAPQFTAWPGNSDVSNILDYAIRHYRVDTTRIYLTGLSMGGGVIWYFTGDSKENSERVSAIVPVCGAGYPERSRYEKMAEANLPVWATHNSGDGTVPVWYTNEFVDGMNNYVLPPTPRARKSIFPVGGHDAWSHTYDLNFRENGLNVYEWMLSNRRGGSGVLAVSELKFSGKTSNGKAVLSWTTSDEKNNAGFAVQRSQDGSRFDSIGYVSGVGNSGGSYSYTDQSPLNGKTLYRLKAVSTSGQVTYSNVISLEIHGLSRVTLFPNPVRDVVNVQTNYAPENALLRIYDMSGKTVAEKKVTGSGNHSVSLNVPAGMYSVILIENGRQTFKQSFIKK